MPLELELVLYVRHEWDTQSVKTFPTRSHPSLTGSAPGTGTSPFAVLLPHRRSLHNGQLPHLYRSRSGLRSARLFIRR
jgi:hypothetical protein